MNIDIVDFPKIQSPFVRKHINKRYVVTPEITEGYEWVFKDDGVIASDKLHGTNVCMIFKEGKLFAIDNRDTRIVFDPFIHLYTNTQTARMMQGLLNSIEKGWVKANSNSRVYGELIGPSLNKNIHRVEANYFVPFDYLKQKCKWNTWFDNKYPKTYESISEWFKGLPSLFTQRIHPKSDQQDFAEGLVFHHPDGRMAKLRRDMFDWYYEDKGRAWNNAN